MFICGPGYMYDLSPLNRFLIALYRPRQLSDKAHKKYIHIEEEHYRKKRGEPIQGVAIFRQQQLM